MSAIEIPEGSLSGLDNLPYGIVAVGGAAPRAGMQGGQPRATGQGCYDCARS
jgi:fumarylacetoacetase